MSEFKDNLRQLRKEAGLTQGQLAQQLGVSQSSIGMYEHGMREPNIEMLTKLAEHFDTNIDFLITGIKRSAPVDDGDILPIKKVRVPIIGAIACGEPIFADREYEGYIDTGSDSDFDFCLRCEGDSMINAGIPDGAIVFIRKQDMVENGEIAAVVIDSQITLKRVAYYPEKNTLILKPDNPNYNDLVYIGKELDAIRILGKAVAVQNKL